MELSRVGFMQGRLSPMVDGRIQAFPWHVWRDEFPLAQKYDFHLMEYTLDQERLYENPLLTSEGQTEIRQLCRRHAIQIPSLTGDCFMQVPFWKASTEQRSVLEQDFLAVAKACYAVGITLIVVPLVDNGRLENRNQEDQLIGFLSTLSDFLLSNQLRIVFESDFGPAELARFIGRLDPLLFGVNYDIGNSAALGYSVNEEFAAYGYRILNVHVKDRVRGGTTVALGTGAVNFIDVFEGLGRINYRGNFILQTARALDDKHAEVLARYRDMTVGWMRYLTHGS